MVVTDPLCVAISYTRNAELVLMLKHRARRLTFYVETRHSQAHAYLEMRP